MNFLCEFWFPKSFDYTRTGYSYRLRLEKVLSILVSVCYFGFCFWEHLWVWVLMCHSPLPGISQVLATLQKNAEAAGSTAPFPLHSQYVPSVLAGRVDGEDGSDDGDDKKQLKPKPKGKPKKKTSKVPPPKKTVKLESKPEGWCYNSIRTKFMDKLRSDGKSFVEASELWDQSMEKARYLAPCSVTELKKRRFLPKGSNTNPWLEKVNGPTN